MPFVPCPRTWFPIGVLSLLDTEITTQQIWMAYCRVYMHDRDRDTLRNGTQHRLSLILQQLVHLLTRTKGALTQDVITAELSQRYMTVCHMLGDANQAHKFWLALYRFGQKYVLHGDDIAMRYIHTQLEWVIKNQHQRRPEVNMRLDHTIECVASKLHACCVIVVGDVPRTRATLHATCQRASSFLSWPATLLI